MAATPTRVADFIQSIGICAHINSTNSSYGSSDVAGQMSYLGINNMRVMAPGSNLQLYTSLGQKGIKFDVISNDFNLQQDMSLFDKIAPYVTSIEGVNELNSFAFNYNGLSGAAGADAFQADLYKAIHADPKLAGVKVLPFSLSVGSNINGWGDVSAYADYGNVHGYAGQGVPPYYMLNYAVNSITTTPGKPAMMTETGYYTQNDGNSGVTEDVQAKWMLDTLFENSHNGVVRTYLYQLEDGYATPSTDLENHYGLYKVDGTAKESATALHNLTTILADTGANAATFTPGTLNYTVTGLNPDYGFQHVLAKSNGSFDIALWSEPQFFDAGSYKTSDVPATTVTVKFGGTYNVDVFDPIKGTGAIAHYQGVTSVDMQLATDPLVVEVSPVGTVPQAAAAPVPAPAVTPVTAAAVTPVTAAAVTPAAVPVTAPAVTSAVTQASAPPVAQVTTSVDATPANATGAPLSVDPVPRAGPGRHGRHAVRHAGQAAGHRIQAGHRRPGRDPGRGTNGRSGRAAACERCHPRARPGCDACPSRGCGRPGGRPRHRGNATRFNPAVDLRQLLQRRHRGRGRSAAQPGRRCPGRRDPAGRHGPNHHAGQPARRHVEQHHRRRLDRRRPRRRPLHPQGGWRPGGRHPGGGRVARRRPKPGHHPQRPVYGGAPHHHRHLLQRRRRRRGHPRRRAGATPALRR